MIKDQTNKKDYEGPLYARHPDLAKRQSSTTSVGVTSSGTSSSANSSESTN